MTNSIRLSPFEIHNIKHKAIEIFGADSAVYIYGSRVKEEKRGGDIDIYIETTQSNILDSKLKYLVELEKAIGEQKIDVIVDNKTMQKKIYNVAKNSGVRL